MPFDPGKGRNIMASLKRNAESAWFGADVSARAQIPTVLNGEFVTAVNAAGSGVVNLIGLDANNKVQLGDSGLQNYITVALTAAQLIAMFTTPVQIVPAPGAGKIIVLDNFVLQMKPGGTPFTGGGAVALQYGGAGTIIASATVPASQVTSATANNNSVPSVSALTVPTNSALNISNATAAFAAGNGTAIVTAVYSIVTLG